MVDEMKDQHATESNAQTSSSPLTFPSPWNSSPSSTIVLHHRKHSYPFYETNQRTQNHYSLISYSKSNNQNPHRDLNQMEQKPPFDVVDPKAFLKSRNCISELGERPWTDLGPVRFELDDLFCVGQGIEELFKRGIRC